MSFPELFSIRAKWAEPLSRTEYREIRQEDIYYSSMGGLISMETLSHCAIFGCSLSPPGRLRVTIGDRVLVDTAPDAEMGLFIMEEPHAVTPYMRIKIEVAGGPIIQEAFKGPAQDEAIVTFYGWELATWFAQLIGALPDAPFYNKLRKLGVDLHELHVLKRIPR